MEALWEKDCRWDRRRIGNKQRGFGSRQAIYVKGSVMHDGFSTGSGLVAG